MKCRIMYVPWMAIPIKNTSSLHDYPTFGNLNVPWKETFVQIKVKLILTNFMSPLSKEMSKALVFRKPIKKKYLLPKLWLQQTGLFYTSVKQNMCSCDNNK